MASEPIAQIKASHSTDFVNHPYDNRPNWTPLSPITVTNTPICLQLVVKKMIKVSYSVSYPESMAFNFFVLPTLTAAWIK